MKNLLALIVLTVFALQIGNAQNPSSSDAVSYKKGQIDVTVGIGIVPLHIPRYGLVKVQSPFVNLDYAVSNKLSVGFHYGQSEEIYNKNILGVAPATINLDNKFAGVRVLGHISNYANWDIYGGAVYARNFGTAVVESEDPALIVEFEDSELRKNVFSGVIGTRWRILPRLGLVGEIGFNGASLINVGANVRF